MIFKSPIYSPPEYPLHIKQVSSLAVSRGSPEDLLNIALELSGFRLYRLFTEPFYPQDTYSPLKDHVCLG